MTGPRWTPMFMVPLAAAALLLAVSPARASRSADGLWADVAEPSAASRRPIVPRHYRTAALDWTELRHVLSNAPMESAAAGRAAGAVITLPLPGGDFGRFRVVESPIMHPKLAARFPEIRTYSGQGIDDPSATLRMDTTPAGLHAMILSATGDVFIDPWGAGDSIDHISYHKSDFLPAEGSSFECRLQHKPSGRQTSGRGGPASEPPLLLQPSGTSLRTYRAAVAATGEYTQFHGGTVSSGLAAVVTAMNRVNGIYEREVAVRMVLVANNDQLIYTDPASDPYSNFDGFSMLGQNQQNVDQVIGRNNYDIGHVFSTGGGGVAYLGVVCERNFKAQGVTGLPTPTGDPFYVDYVAHEMGHQWGGNHTFNGTVGSCSGGNRNASTAYEPGSGTTIMAYAGICGSQNIQANSDAYFHTISFDEIVAYSTAGGGGACAVTTATGNSPPAVDPGLARTIPLSTPFVMCGSATDPDMDSLTYGWEQFNLGPGGSPTAPSGDAPIFRSFTPTASPCRTFPQLSDLQSNTMTIGEILPGYARTLTFRLTARDNRAGGGGVDHAQVDVVVDGSSGPFRVTSPDSAVTWQVGETRDVLWDVAGTDQLPVDCPLVDILMSSDSGASFPSVLAGATANDGSEPILVPFPATQNARVKVQCSNNIFFDMSSVDFTVQFLLPDAVGRVPDGNLQPGLPLTVDDAGGGDITLSWAASCSASDQDYAIYEGTLGDFTSHTALLCTTGGQTSRTLTPGGAGTYYLVVPRNTIYEGSYGFDSGGAERPASLTGACANQLILTTCQ